MADAGRSTGSAPLTVVVVDQGRRVRQGLRSLLTTFEGVEVVGEARRGSEVIELAETLKPDVLLMGGPLPDGLAAANEIRWRGLAGRIVLLTLSDTGAGNEAAWCADVVLPKGCTPDELLEALRGPLGRKRRKVKASKARRPSRTPGKRGPPEMTP